MNNVISFNKKKSANEELDKYNQKLQWVEQIFANNTEGDILDLITDLDLLKQTEFNDGKEQCVSVLQYAIACNHTGSIEYSNTESSDLMDYTCIVFMTKGEVLGVEVTIAFSPTEQYCKFDSVDFDIS